MPQVLYCSLFATHLPRGFIGLGSCVTLDQLSMKTSSAISGRAVVTGMTAVTKNRRDMIAA